MLQKEADQQIKNKIIFFGEATGKTKNFFQIKKNELRRAAFNEWNKVSKNNNFPEKNKK